MATKTVYGLGAGLADMSEAGYSAIWRIWASGS